MSSPTGGLPPGWVRLALPGATVLWSDRTGGVSEPPFDTANVSTRTADDPGHVTENRARLDAAMHDGRPASPWFDLVQVHGARVVSPGPAPAGPPEADASATDRTDVTLVVLTADCVPLALVAPGAVGAVHAGWRGLVAGVVEAGVAAVRDRSPGPVTAFVGPCIRACCYEFGESDLATVVDRLGPTVASTTRQGQPSLDVPAGVRRALAAAQVDRVVDLGRCTSCTPTDFSWRRDRTPGRQAMLVRRVPT